MSMFMSARNGAQCWAGVRRLAEVSGLDKGTVAKHRVLAVAAGWLIPSPSPRHRQLQTFSASLPVVPCVPTAAVIPSSESRVKAPLSAAPASPLPIDQLVAAVRLRVKELSEENVQSEARPYGLRAVTVRSQPLNCTARPDQSSISIKDQESDSESKKTDRSPEKMKEDEARAHLKDWMEKKNFAALYAQCPERICQMAPAHCRFEGYEQVVRETGERTKRGAGG
jgi:hypothetical protein